MSAIANRSVKDRKRRAALRAKLLAEGVNEHLIEKIIEQQAHNDLVARHGESAVREIRRKQASKGPDDTGYEPSIGDPLLRGTARVQGIAAKVVRKSQTITQFQYDDLAGRTTEELQ